jgi:hypothetical protein
MSSTFSLVFLLIILVARYNLPKTGLKEIITLILDDVVVPINGHKHYVCVFCVVRPTRHNLRISLLQ